MNILIDEHQFRIFRRKKITVLCHGDRVVRQMNLKEYRALVARWPEETTQDKTSLRTVWSLIEVKK